MASFAKAGSILKAAGRRRATGGPDALTQIRVDALAEELLDGIGLSIGAIEGRVSRQLGDLRRVLASDYSEAPGLPPRPLMRELSRIVDRQITPHPDILRRWRDPRSFRHLVSRFGPREIEVWAQPYRSGAGLSLWGFSCPVPTGGGGKLLIFINSAHERGAVAATIGHEIGHYIYGSIGNDASQGRAAMESIFGAHLMSEPELFSDSLVALSAFSIATVRGLVGRGRSGREGCAIGFDRLRRAFEVVDPQYRIELTRQGLTTPWRIRYLTSMIHFFKLRCALLESAEI